MHAAGKKRKQRRFYAQKCRKYRQQQAAERQKIRRCARRNGRQKEQPEASVSGIEPQQQKRRKGDKRKQHVRRAGKARPLPPHCAQKIIDKPERRAKQRRQRQLRAL